MKNVIHIRIWSKKERKNIIVSVWMSFGHCAHYQEHNFRCISGQNQIMSADSKMEVALTA